MSSKKIANLFLFLFFLQALVNLIGALGPELGFDALWYHLTEAKLFLHQGSINPIKGNLLYWSGLPRLAEIIYALALKVWDERLTKLIHYLAGLVSAYLVYQIARKKYSHLAATVASLLFYTTLLVGWLSTSSYIDLIVTALFLAALNTPQYFQKVIYLILLGATKLTAVPLGLAVSLIPWPLLGVLPFMMINFFNFKNPFYPFLSDLNLANQWFFNGFWFWLSRPLRIFIDPAFRVGPVILLLILLFRKKINWQYLKKPLLIVFFFWWLGPGTGFGRFALPLLALLSIILASLFHRPPYNKLALTLVMVQVFSGIALRVWANQKYLPVIFKHQTKQEFLTQNLKFHFGDFYDVDNWFADNLKPTDKVLIYNIHNLYYVNFPFDHQSWADNQTRYTHLLVGDNQPPPKPYSYLIPIYQNPTTRVKLYKLP